MKKVTYICHRAHPKLSNTLIWPADMTRVLILKLLNEYSMIQYGEEKYRIKVHFFSGGSYKKVVCLYYGNKISSCADDAYCQQTALLSLAT